MFKFPFTADADDEALMYDEHMQAWSESLEHAGAILGEAYGDADLLGGHYMRPIEQDEPAKPVQAFDPYECTVLQKPMSVSRTRITMKSRGPSF